MASKAELSKGKVKQMPLISPSKKAPPLKPNEARPSVAENPSIMKKTVASSSSSTSAPKGSISRPPPPANKPPALPNLEKKKASPSMDSTPAKVPPSRQKSFIQNRPSSTKAKDDRQPSRKEGPNTKAVPASREKSFVQPEKTAKKQQLEKDQQKDEPRSQMSERSPKPFQRQRSFISGSNNNGNKKEGNNSRLSPGSGRFEKSSPKFGRSKTQSHIELSGFRQHRRSSNSSNFSEHHHNEATSWRTATHLNPQAKEFIMKKEVPGLAPPTIEGLSDQEKNVLWEAVQPPTPSMKTKVRALIQMSDVLMRAALKESRLSTANAVLVCSKIIEMDANETFIESLLNSLLEYHHNATVNGLEHSKPYIMFLCELYQLLKRRHLWDCLEASDGDTRSPRLHLLSLLSQWCLNLLASITHGAKVTAIQLDLLTHVFTMIGQELTGSSKLVELRFHLRDAFLFGEFDSEDASLDHVKGLLLRLIELQSCDWQLSPAAISYYFPQNSAASPLLGQSILPAVVCP